jgi:hypothetical protein
MIKRGVSLMSEQQKRAAAALSFLIVLAASFFLLWLSVAVIGSQESLGDKRPGRQFMLAIGSWGLLDTALKALPVIITVGIGLLARYKLKDWQFYGTVAASVIGVVAAAYLLIEVSSVETARRFWAYSPVPRLEDYNSFVSAAQATLVTTVIWLVGVLGIQLGIKGGNP